MRLTYKWQAAIVVTIGLFMAVLDNTIVSVTLPQMANAFSTSFETITWVATAYFLAQAAIIPVTGYLSDRTGTKLVFLTSLALFTLGSGLCAIAPTKELLIGFRVLQGIGAGALFPTAFAIVFRIFPPTERGPASAVVSVPVLLAPAFGPTIGGYLTTTFDWRAIFTINLPIGIISLILGFLVLKGRTAEREMSGIAALEKKRFDILGLLLAMTGFSVLVYGITEAGPKGWSDPTVVWSLTIGGVVLLAFILVELLVSDPVLDLRLFLNYTFSMSNLLMWALGAFLFGSLFLLPFFFENVQGKTPLTAGEILIAQGLAAAVAVATAGRLYNRVGPRLLTATGLTLVTIGTIGFTNLEVSTSGASLQLWLILRGFGLGLTNLPLQTLALSVVSNQAMARASSLVNVTRQVFSAVGVAGLTTYLAQQTTQHVHDITAAFQGQPLQQAQTACVQKLGLSNPAAIADCVKQAGQQYVLQHVPQAITLGLNDTFWVVLLACGACAMLALFLGRDPAIEAAKHAKSDNETPEERPVAVIGE